MILTIYRTGTPLNFVNIDRSTVYIHEVMGLHEIRCPFISQEPLDIRVDDYILWEGERFNINVLYPVRKVSNFDYRYEIVFESYLYWLKDKIFRHLEAVEFNYVGTAATLLGIVVSNMNEVDTGWAVGTVDATEEKNVHFYGEERGFTCKGALMKIAEEFGLEFWLTGKTIHLTRQAGVDTNLDFEYGRGRGLYEVTRGGLETPLYNRIYGYGGTKNLPLGYRGKATRLMFDEKGLERPLGVGERRRETSVIFDDIFPNRTGTLTAVSADWLELTDTSLDFDINDHFVQGTDWAVVFKSGELAGHEFVIDTYNHATKTITINPFVEEGGYTYPNSTFEAHVGDQYTLIGISMPQSYVNAAEAELKAETIRVFNTISRPPFQVVVDPHYMRVNAVKVKAGDRVRLRYPELNIDDMIRVTTVSYPLVEPDEVTFVISDKIIYTNEVLQEIDKNKVKTDIVVVDRTKAELARRNMMQYRRLQGLVFDPDGHFDPEKIKPFSIETYMLSIGAKSQNFGLNGVAINTNTGGNPNHLSISGGSLIHYELEVEGLGHVWQLQGNEFPGLDPAKPYYLSAKCSRTALTGEWYLSEDQKTVESEAGYFHFNIGILYSVIEGYRGFDFTKGMTLIVGDQITTGTLKSIDGLVFINLTEGTFFMGDENQSIDWGVTEPGQLSINGALVTKMAFAENAEIINLLVKSLRTSPTGQRMEILEGENKLNFFNSQDELALTIDDSIDSDQAGQALAGIRAAHGAQVAYLTGNGLFSNAGGYSFLPAHMGIQTNASVVGILPPGGKNSDPNGISAAVVGIDGSTTGASRSYGGYFSSLFAGGLNVQTEIVTGSISIVGEVGCWYSCYNQADIDIHLPASPRPGRLIFIRKNNDYELMVQGSGKQIVNDSQVSSIPITGQWTTAVLMWDGQNWMFNVWARQ